MDLTHPGLKELLLIEQYGNGQRVGFLSLETIIPNWFKNLTVSIPNYTIGLTLRREYRHIAMGFRGLKLKDVDTIFVFEMYLQHVFIALILLALTGKQVLICLHGDQQFAETKRLKFLGLLYLKVFLKLFKFKVVLFEINDDVLPEHLRLPEISKVIIPHPLRSDVEPALKCDERSLTDTKIKVGVVGMIREDKPIFQVVEKLLAYTQKPESNCELIIGVPFHQKTKQLEQLGVRLFDTTQETSYFELLKELDVLVTFFKEDRYYYRASGVISDAVSCGCYVIAPDYPVIKHQINYPAEVGNTFRTLDEIDLSLDKAITDIRKNGKNNQWAWREKRLAPEIAKLLLH